MAVNSAPQTTSLTPCFIREPQDRARMDAIRVHPWLATVQPDKSVIAGTARYEHGRPVLTKEQHEAVMSTMKKGGFTAAAVQEAFRGRTYDYITSTFCLLAEREVCTLIPTHH